MEWAWLAPALSVAAFPIVALGGKYLPGRGAWLTIAAIAGGFLVSLFVFSRLIATGEFEESHHFSVLWFTAGSVDLTMGQLVDPKSSMMLVLITFVATMVQVYSLGYMKGEPRLHWYFAVHALFAASMMGLVLADNLLLLYVAWELVGACSFLLIGFWWEKRSAAEAAKKAFITTRIGDVGMLIGILVLFKATGSFDITTILHAAEGGDIAQGTLTVAALLLFLGAMGKSAQFPLHVWLPDAMEGPTPVSALIHAATMVTAGVFLVARMYPVFEAAAPIALTIVGTIGLITAITSGLMALVMTDMKRVLAYSTVSHLGLMMVALGVGAVTAAMFHLLMHGFSKALAFLGAGSVMHGANKTDIRTMGNLGKLMPITAWTFSIGALSLAGIPPLAGFWSKDGILHAVQHEGQYIYLAVLLGFVVLSALYMARVTILAFWRGAPLDPHAGPAPAVHHGAAAHDTEHATSGGTAHAPMHTTHADDHGGAHDAPPAMALPLMLLAVLATVGGTLAFLKFGGYHGFGEFVFAHEPEHFAFSSLFSSVALLGVGLAVIGLAIGWAAYKAGAINTASIRNAFGPVARFFERKMYLDEAYQWAINRVVLTAAGILAWFDRAVVNDIAVNGPANLVRATGWRLRYHVTGKVYNYALAMVVGLVGLAGAWWFFAG